MRGILAAAAVAVCIGSVFVSAAAGATVTIGAPDVSFAQLEVGCPEGKNACLRTYAQLGQPTAGVLLNAPAEGVITGWRLHADTGGEGSLALRVLRRDADGVRFTGVATSPAVTAFPLDGAPSHPVSIPVQTGDYIGVDVAKPATLNPFSRVGVFATEPSGATAGLWENGLANGSTAESSSSSPGVRLMLNAVESLRPAVSGVSPSSGSTGGGEAVTINGSNLDGATRVSFGSVPSPSFTASATQITATAPAGVQGSVHVQVAGPGGVSPATGADFYSYVSPGVVPPVILVVPPGNGLVMPPASGAAPIVSGVSETVKTWRANNRPARISARKKTPVGTTFSFSLNEPATVTLRFTERGEGRTVHGKCVTATKKNRNQPGCVRAIPAGRLIHASHQGPNKVGFGGRISNTSKLEPGQYTLQITATDTQGKRSAPRSLTFTIVK